MRIEVQVSERNAAAVRAAVAQGVLVFIATGKVRKRGSG
jgi:hydroxymethylpyrimidine pyrophosphatase-like HAD family hydrolase